MKNEYDAFTAFHYNAYRPQLHSQILEHCISTKTYFLGLDVGCGTGQSAIALTKNCQNVIGIDPSTEMLGKSIEHPKVVYHHYDGHIFNFQDYQFDVITFAGSLFYAKSQQLLDEVVRVSKNEADIIIYDFDILLNPLLEKLNLKINSSDYNHQINFEGLNQEYLTLKEELKSTITLPISTSNIAHIILSVQDYYQPLAHHYGQNNLHHSIAQQLTEICKKETVTIRAKTFATLYQIKK